MRIMEDRCGDRKSGLIDQACDAVEHLCRYRKTPQCSSATKAVICDLKVKMVRHLYTHGYVLSVNYEPAESRECHFCNGTGKDIRFQNRCRACQGSGRYRPSGFSEALVAFRFMVHGREYGFHLPDKDVEFAYPLRRNRYEEYGAESNRQPKRHEVGEAIRIVRVFLQEAG